MPDEVPRITKSRAVWISLRPPRAIDNIPLPLAGDVVLAAVVMLFVVAPLERLVFVEWLAGLEGCLKGIDV
jgi:hypothetical protein